MTHATYFFFKAINPEQGIEDFGANRKYSEMRTFLTDDPVRQIPGFGKLVLVLNVTELRVHLTTGLRDCGSIQMLRLYFSFHPETQLPTRLASGKYNCSVDYFACFRKHLDCNKRRECQGG